jgi:hypothetical protein
LNDGDWSSKRRTEEIVSPHAIAELSIQPVPWILVDPMLGWIGINVSTAPPGCGASVNKLSAYIFLATPDPGNVHVLV